MNAPRCTEFDYIDYLVASPRTVTCTEAARVQPERRDAPSHDAFSRLLYRLEPDPEALWAAEVKGDILRILARRR